MGRLIYLLTYFLVTSGIIFACRALHPDAGSWLLIGLVWGALATAMGIVVSLNDGGES